MSGALKGHMDITTVREIWNDRWGWNFVWVIILEGVISLGKEVYGQNYRMVVKDNNYHSGKDNNYHANFQAHTNYLPHYSFLNQEQASPIQIEIGSTQVGPKQTNLDGYQLNPSEAQ